MLVRVFKRLSYSIPNLSIDMYFPEGYLDNLLCQVQWTSLNLPLMKVHLSPLVRLLTPPLRVLSFIALVLLNGNWDTRFNYLLSHGTSYVDLGDLGWADG